MSEGYLVFIMVMLFRKGAMNLIDQRHVVTLPSCFQSFLHYTPLYPSLLLALEQYLILVCRVTKPGGIHG